MNDKFVISASTLNKVINQLGQYPYNQVSALIAEIRKDVKPVEIVDKQSPKEVAEG